MTSNPWDFYKQRIARFKSDLKTLRKSLQISSLLRLLTFVITIAGAYFFYGAMYPLLFVLITGISCFVWLLLRHKKLSYKKNKTQALIDINKTELDVLDRQFKDLYEGLDFSNPKHYYSSDIDLFGAGSFYQYLNRSVLTEGQSALAGILKSNNPEDILDKQEIIKELSALPEWRQDFMAIARLIKQEMSMANLRKWIEGYTPVIPKVMQFVPIAFSSFSILLILLYLSNIIPGFLLLFWFFTGLGITGKYVLRINKLSQACTGIQNSLQQYQKLLALIEEREFTSATLKEKRLSLLDKNNNSSQALRQFYRYLDALDQRNNILVGVVLNGFFLWDLRQAFNIESWIANNSANLMSWLETLVFFDAYNSLGNFAFNHPQYIYPRLIAEDTVIRANNLGHPMLDPKESVVNNFNIQLGQFYIITGANMAGKSTFLRTISLFIVMSNVGLPVCAEKADYSPIKLITSMRTVDSLASNESYFYAELKRLKYITEVIKEDSYFVILDEILKGTNSKDKAVGSEKFIEKLVNSKVVGITATHDISLCELAHKNSKVKNYFFDAKTKENELFFDYRFQEGICTNMNASFLLKKMKIIDS